MESPEGESIVSSIVSHRYLQLRWTCMLVVNAIIAFIFYETGRNFKVDVINTISLRPLFSQSGFEFNNVTSCVNETHASFLEDTSGVFRKKMRYPITFPKLNIGHDVVELNLSCPFQALVYGRDLAVTSQRYRLLTLFEDVYVCRRVYFMIGMNEKSLHYIDGPGSSFTQRMRNSVPMRDYGNMIHLTGYPFIHKDGLRPHKEPAFFEYLFGFSFNEPCIGELEDHCSRVKISH